MTDQSAAGLIPAWCEIVARAWTDDAFRERVKARPGEVLREYNVEDPPGVSFRVVENGPAEMFLVLPVPPQEVDRVAGAGNVTVDQYYAACI